MNRKKRILICLAILLILLIGIPVTRFYGEVQHARRNQELIDAIKAGNTRKALEALASGADGDARDVGRLSLRKILSRSWGRITHSMPTDKENHPSALHLLYSDDRHFTSHTGFKSRLVPDRALVKSLLDHGACLSDADGEGPTSLVGDDPATAKALYKQAEAANPKNPDWPDRLGNLYLREEENAKGNRQKMAEQALAAYERALNHTQKEDRVWILSDVPTAAFDAGDLVKARAYAEEMLKIPADPFGLNYNDGDNNHHGHLILGRIALRKGDIKEAKAQLLAAGQVRTSPVLSSFGPNMMLAKGESKTVLEYFKLCSKFWTGMSGELNIWTREVQAGKAPDFGANLNY